VPAAGALATVIRSIRAGTTAASTFHRSHGAIEASDRSPVRATAVKYRRELLGIVTPLFCAFTSKRVVILGGGRVALRKARRFVPEADVSVHAPEFATGFESLPCELVRERVDPDRGRDLLEDAFLAVVATDNTDLNARLTGIAREQGCLVDRTDRSGGGTGDDTESEATTGTEATQENVTIGSNAS
jgi:precorrin-2 dehydrogenase/sirohydrochlorin ferrochelatase